MTEGSTTTDAAPELADALPNIDGLDILIFGINYAPEPTGIAPYTTGMAEYLASCGAHVTVLAGVPHYPSWKVPAEFRRALSTRATVNGVELIRLRHTVPSIMTAGRRALYEVTFLLHAFVRSIRRRPDVIIAVSPALGGVVAAGVLARLTGIPLLTVVQDVMAKAAGQSGITGGGRAEALTSRLEGFALRSSDEVMVVSDSFRAGVLAYGVPAERVSLLRNWTHISPTTCTRDEARKELDWPAATFLVVHTGNMGFKQDLGNVIEASRFLSPADCTEIVFVGDGSQRHDLETQAIDAPHVRFVDPVDNDTYPVVLAAADVLLVNERASVEAMSLPSKITSYLIANRPILAAVSEGGATWCELTDAAAALTVPAGSPGRLADAVRELRSRDALRSQLAAAGSARVQSHLSASSSLSALHRVVHRLFKRRADEVASVG